MKAFPPVTLRGDLEAAKNHRGVNIGNFPKTGRHTFVMSGVFVGPSNQLQIASKLEQLGFLRRTTVNHTTALVVYSSEIDPSVAIPGKLAAAIDTEVPFILNEAAACELLDITFMIPKTRKEEMAAIAEGRRPGDTYQKTGRSSRLALGYILEAWGQPGVEIRIHDHFGSTAADRNLACMIHDMIDKLGLRGFNVERRLHDPMVVFHGY